MQFFWCAIVYVALSTLRLPVFAQEKEASYTIELEKFIVREDTDSNWLDWDSLRAARISRNKYGITGSFKLLRNMGDDQSLSVVVYTYDNDLEEQGARVFNYSRTICQFVREDNATYPQMTKKSNMPKEPGCPFPKGTYEFNNYEVATDFLPDTSPRGPYLVIFSFFDGNRNIGGYDILATLTDK